MNKIDLDRLFEIFLGILYSFLAIFVTIAIITYNEFDPSFNTATTTDLIFNKCGKIGACVSDLLIQLFGFVAIFIILIFIKVSFDHFRSKEKKYNVYIKIISIILFLLSTCGFCSKVFHWKNPWGYEDWGGAIGYYVNSLLFLTPEKFLIPLYILSCFVSAYIVFEFNYKIFLICLKKIFIFCKYLVKIQFIFILKIGSLLIPKIIKRKFKSFFSKIYKFFNRHKIEREKYQDLIKNQNKKIQDLEKYITNVNNKISDDNFNIDDIKNKPKNNGILSSIFSGKSVNKLFGNKFKLPTLDLLNSSNNKSITLTKEELKEQASNLIRVLHEYKITGKIISVKAGPIITLHEFEPSAGTKSSRIVGCADDIARNLKVKSTRISVIPERNVVGIELPNKQRNTIFLRDIFESSDYKNSNYALPIVLGSNIAGDPVVMDLAKAPHLLIAGTTGSGKSVSINTMILSLLYKFTYDECKMIMIDPKMLELSVYEGIPHLLTPVVTDPKKAVLSLKWVVNEMENRYRTMSSLGVRNIYGYNEKIDQAINNNTKLISKTLVGYDEYGEPIYESKELKTKHLPFIVVIVDEMADLMITAGKDIEALIQRIAQMARAAGIHIIMATQRPSVDIITGVIKANFPSRISFLVSSRIDSKVILGEQGAEQLLGMGDMLYMPNGGKINRAHGPFVSDDEVERVVEFINRQGFKPEYIKTIIDNNSDDSNTDNYSNFDISITGQKDDDESLYQQAIEIIRRDKKTSISYIQRQLRIGYNKAANIIERMEREGIVSPPNINGKRELL